MKTTANDQTDFAPENERNENRRFFRKKNQLVFIEYENPTDTGHKITVMDSYRNVLGRIHEKYDEQSNKFEYTFKDNEGALLFKSEELPQLKEEIAKHKTVMMEKAHQKRINSKLEKESRSNLSPKPFRRVYVQKKVSPPQQKTREEEIKKLRKEQDREQEISR